MGRRLLSDESGASLVEFALVFPMFVGLLLVTLQIGVLGMVSADFNNAVAATARMIRTGQADGPKDQAAFQAMICSRVVIGQWDCAKRLTTDVQSFSSVTCASNAQGKAPGTKLPNGCGAAPANGFNGGVARDIVVVTATYAWPVVAPFTGAAFDRTSGGQVAIRSRFVFRNEPYS